MNQNIQAEKRWTYKKILKLVGAFLALSLLISIVTLSYIKVDKAIIAPGSAELVKDKIDFGQTPTFSSYGEIRFLTVLVSSRKPSYTEYLIAKYLRNDVEILPWEKVNGDLTIEQSDEINEALMKQSQNTAAFVALNTIGCEVKQKGTGAIISAIEKNSPAGSELKTGDVIVSINEIPISLDSDAGKEIRKNDPGSEIVVTIERGKEKKRIDKKIVLGQSPYEKGESFLGVGLLTRDLDITLPIDIAIDPGAVSGPSAGLAFTLSIIDQLTKGDLTGGKIVSATGEISLNGQVGPVGGVTQKTVAAKKVGTQILIVPKGEGKQARKRSGSMKVVEAENIKEAIDAIEKNGGQKIKQMQSCPST